MNPYQRQPPYYGHIQQQNYSSNYRENTNNWQQSAPSTERSENWSSSGHYEDQMHGGRPEPRYSSSHMNGPPQNHYASYQGGPMLENEPRSALPSAHEWDRQSLSSNSSFNFSERPPFDRSRSNSVQSNRTEHSYRASASSMPGVQHSTPIRGQNPSQNQSWLTPRGSVSSMSSDVFRDDNSYHGSDALKPPMFNSSTEQLNRSSLNDSGYNSTFRSRDTSSNTPRQSVGDRLGPSRELSSNVSERLGTINEVDSVSIQGPVYLDNFNCDLFVTVSHDGYTAYDLGEQGFQHLWGGIRATHGVKYGKVAFEVKLEQNLPVEFEESEKNQGGAPHVTRVGWSEDFTDLQLGEVANSYGYGGTAKKSHRRQFHDYGIKFGVGDVVTCYLDKRDDGSAEISYAVNGRFLGYAFQICASNKPLFPHVSMKNMKFTVNFGAYENYFPLENGFEMVDYCQHLTPGFKSGDFAEDYEWIMLVGLPAAGKTTYIEDFVKKHPEKKYVVLGTNSIMEKMRVCNLFRKFNYHERFEKLFQLANEILKLLMKFSERKLRNYILDQTNVFQSARIRKKKFYEGYQCHCYVFVCNAEELERRTVKTGRESGKWVPVNAVMNMKKNFKLPDESERWRSISYVEENEESSRIIVAAFNKEANLFYRNGENNLAENNEVPHPKYKKMIEDDPRGVNDGPPLSRKTPSAMLRETSNDFSIQSKRPRFESNSSFAGSMGRESGSTADNNSEYLMTSRFSASMSKPQAPPSQSSTQNRTVIMGLEVKQEPRDFSNSSYPKMSNEYSARPGLGPDMSKFESGFIPEVKKEAPPFASRKPPFPLARGMRLDSLSTIGEEHFPENRDQPPYGQQPYYGEQTGFKREAPAYGSKYQRFPGEYQNVSDRNNFPELPFDGGLKQEPPFPYSQPTHSPYYRGGNNRYGY